MGGQLIEGAERKTMFLVDPLLVLVAGLDFTEEEEPELYTQFYDERIRLPLNEQMIESIMNYGVREPCECVVLSDERIIISSGRQRTRHLREATQRVTSGDRRKLPVIGVKGSEVVLNEAALIGEMLNHYRQDDSVLTKADKATRLIDVRGYTVKQVALAFGVTEQTIGEYRKIAGLSKAARTAVERGQLAPSAAAKLAKLSKEEQASVVEQIKATSPNAGTAAANGKPRKPRKPKQATVKEVAAAVENVMNVKEGSAEVAPPPGKKKLRSVVENGKDVLPDNFIRGIRYAMGDITDADVASFYMLDPEMVANGFEK